MIVLALCAGIAAAQPTAEDKTQAKAAFARAEAAERRKDWRVAIDEYQRAYDLLPHPDVLFNIAVDLERLEEYRDAATYYRRYLDDKGDDAPDRTKVEALIGKLRGRPGTVTVTSDPPGAEVALDGKVAGPAPVELAFSGAHVITVRRGELRTERRISVEFGEPQTVAIALTERPGTLMVRSNIDRARVTVDDQPRGTTPIEIALPAGPHRVQVAADGWSTYDRPVEIHAEGTTQMTANLVRPLGYTPPVEAAPAPRFYIGVSGGADTRGAGALYAVMFGWRGELAEGGLGYGYVDQGASFALEAKLFVTRTKLRPYLRGSLWFGAMSTLSAHAGLQVQLAQAQRARTSLFVDVGVGQAYTAMSDSSEDESVLYVPVTGGVQLSY